MHMSGGTRSLQQLLFLACLSQQGKEKKPTLDSLLYMKAQEELALTAKVILAARSRLIF